MLGRSFGEKLKDLRTRTGKSQTEVANEISAHFGDAVSISQTTLSTLEQRAIPPREDILWVLAEYYDVPVAYFVEDFDLPVASSRRPIDLAKEYLRSLEKRVIAEQGAQRMHEYPDDDDF